jgi:hypothetical protein
MRTGLQVALDRTFLPHYLSVKVIGLRIGNS